MKLKTIRKVLFALDGPLTKDEFGQFYGTGLNDDIRKRYLNMGKEVTFLIRVVHKKSHECRNLNKIDNDRFSVIEVPNFKSFSTYFTLRPKAKRIVENAVRQHDVVITRLPSGIGTIAVNFANKLGKPLLTEMVACTRDTYWYHSIKGKFIAHYFYYKQRAIMRNVSHCIYVTDGFLQERYPINGKSINCSNVLIDTMSEEILDKRVFKIKEMSDEKPLLIGSIGKLSMKLKGYTDVICAIHNLKTLGIRIQYKLVGGGDTAYLSKLIKKLKLEEEVMILGRLSRTDVFDFIDSVDLYIQPSRTEGLPRAMIEAMSRACPVIGSDAGGIPELTKEGISFKRGNIKQIERALSSLNRDKLLYEASRSFYKAKEYENECLNVRRTSFYHTFLMDNKLTVDE